MYCTNKYYLSVTYTHMDLVLVIFEGNNENFDAVGMCLCIKKLIFYLFQ